MKKATGIFLAGAMIASLLLSGCGNSNQTANNSNETGQNENQAQDQTQSDASEDGVTEIVIEMLYFAMEDPDLQEVTDAINEITVPEIGVKVKFMPTGFTEMATKPGLWQASGEQVDLIMTGAMTTPQNLASQGLLYPLDDLLANSETLTELAGDLLQACRYDGITYAYPLDLYPGTSSGYFYDADLLTQYNIEMPESVETEADLEPYFEQMKEAGITLTPITYGDGVLVYSTYGYNFENLGDNYTSYGVIMDAENNSEVVDWFETDEYAQMCALHYDWAQKGYTSTDSLSNGYTYIDCMSQGTVVGFISSNGASVGKSYYEAQTGKKLGEVKINAASIKNSDVATNSWGISNNCQNPEKVVAFWELLYTNADLANLFNWGIEGKHYVVDEGTRLIGYPEGVDAMSNGYGMSTFAGSMGDRAMLYQRDTSWTEEDLESVTQYGLSGAEISKYIGFNYNMNNVVTENAAVMAAIQQYAPSLNCGAVNPDDVLPQFISALKAAGIDTIVEDTQKQVDAYLAQ